MTWLTPQLDKRVQIGTPSQVSNDDGGFDFEFESVVTLWMGCKPISPGRFIRGEQVNEKSTHQFTVRKVELENIGMAFANGFSIGFDSVSNLNLVKGDYYLFLESGPSYKGRLFKVNAAMNNNEQDEVYLILAEEIEERGTGYPE